MKKYRDYLPSTLSMNILFQLLIFMCQYLYINYWVSDNDSFVKVAYGTDATTYRTQRGKKRVILFLSGGYCLEYHFYIKKTMRDLEKTYPSIMANYELICYEQPGKSSFTAIDDVCGYIRKKAPCIERRIPHVYVPSEFCRPQILFPPVAPLPPGSAFRLWCESLHPAPDSTTHHRLARLFLTSNGRFDSRSQRLRQFCVALRCR